MTVSDKDIAEARGADAPSYFNSIGYNTIMEGQTVIVSKDGDRLYRCDLKGNNWICCDITGSEGGDLIQFAQKIQGFSFPEAVKELRKHSVPSPCLAAHLHHGHQFNTKSISNSPLLTSSFTLPPMAEPHTAVNYLESRGICPEITLDAINQGFIHPLDNGLLFVGRDFDGTPKSATLRSADPNAEFQKRDLRGSEKKFTPILRGKSDEVWIVEGGVDALATHGLALLDGKEPPTAIVSGGAYAFKFLDLKDMQHKVYSYLSKASKVIVALDREKNSETQAATDKAHIKQANYAGEIALKASVTLWRPPVDGGKDVADTLLSRIMLRDRLNPCPDNTNSNNETKGILVFPPEKNVNKENVDSLSKHLTFKFNLPEPFFVNGCKTDSSTNQITATIDYDHNSLFECPHCKQLCKIHSTIPREWQSLPDYNFETILKMNVPRVICSEHGVSTIEIPWARPRASTTTILDAKLLGKALNQTMSNISEEINVSPDRITRIVDHFVSVAREKIDLSTLRKFGVDETNTEKGFKYVTIFIDLELKIVIFVTEGKGSEALEKFAQFLENHGGKRDNITDIAMDMSGAYIKGAYESFPNAHITFDKFHIIQNLNNTINSIRCREVRDQPVLRKTRDIFLKNNENWTEKQKETYSHLSKMNLQTSRAYRFKLALSDILNSGADEITAAKMLKSLIGWGLRSRIPELIVFTKSLKAHLKGILRYFTSRLTSGFVESSNRIIQDIRRRARGFLNKKKSLQFDLPSSWRSRHTHLKGFWFPADSRSFLV
jgi:transposase